jgi:hypothetical protein
VGEADGQPIITSALWHGLDLAMAEDNTYVQQEVTDDGILLRVKQYVKEEKV